MTVPIAQRLRDAVAALTTERVSMQALVHAHGPASQGTVLLPTATPCLLSVPGVGAVLGLRMSAGATVQQPQRVVQRRSVA